MKRILLSLFLAAISLSFVAPEAEARRLGGGGSIGMKRQAPPPQRAPDSTPAQQAPTQAAAAPTAAGATAGAAAAGKRSWMGPIAGLAAGLGLAALASHLGFGEELANMMMMVLLGVAILFVVRLVMRRFAPAPAQQRMQFAGAGNASPSPAAFGSGGGFSTFAEPRLAAVPAAAPTGLPPGFDAAGFERIAKLIFIRMQAANDAGDLDDLRQFSTPEMFAAIKLDLQDRKGAAQQTDVVQLDAQVIDYAEEDGRLIVSVRFHGLIREDKDAPAAPFDELWHLSKPSDGSREWAIAGIAQNA